MSDLREAMARAIAVGLGDDFDNAFATKSEWNAARGEKGGRYRDINEPMQSDYEDAAHGALAAIEAAGWQCVPGEATRDMQRYGAAKMWEQETAQPGIVGYQQAAAIYTAMLAKAPKP